MSVAVVISLSGPDVARYDSPALRGALFAGRAMVTTRGSINWSIGGQCDSCIRPLPLTNWQFSFPAFVRCFLECSTLLGILGVVYVKKHLYGGEKLAARAFKYKTHFPVAGHPRVSTWSAAGLVVFYYALRQTAPGITLSTSLVLSSALPPVCLYRYSQSCYWRSMLLLRRSQSTLRP